MRCEVGDGVGIKPKRLGRKPGRKPKHWSMEAIAVDGARFIVVRGSTRGTFCSFVEKHGTRRVVLKDETWAVTNERCAVFLLARKDHFLSVKTVNAN
jgi:hypothetical protein